MTDYIFNFTDPLKGNFVVKPYTANGNLFPTSSKLSSTATGAATPLLLYGKGHPEYGERVQENLLVLSENFSGAAPPIVDSSGNTLTGILWHREKLYNRVGAFNWFAWSSGSWGAATVSEGVFASRPSTGSNNELYYATDTVELYRYSDDERNIQAWVEIEFSTGALPLEPERALMVNNDGTSSGWQELQKATGSLAFLRIDTVNDPLTGNLEIQKTDPIFSLTDTIGSPTTTNTSIVLEGDSSLPKVKIIGTNAELLMNNQPGGAGTNWKIQATTAGNNLNYLRDAVIYFQVTSTGLMKVDPTFAIGGGYESLVLTPNDIPNKQYVDDAIATAAGSPSTGPDSYVSAGSFTIPGTLNLSVNSVHPSFPGGINITDVTADNISINSTGSPLGPFTIGGVSVFEVEEAIIQLDVQKASLSGDTFTGDVTFSTDVAVTGETTFNGDANFNATVTGPSPLEDQQLATKIYVDGTVSGSVASNNDRNHSREIIYGANTNIVQLPFDYPAGTNGLFVFRDGRKQYKDVFGFDEISFSSTIIGSSSIAGLPSYTIIELSGSPQDSFVIAGNHLSEFTAGDTFNVYNNVGLGTPTLFTVIGTPTLNASPPGTVIQVTVPASMAGATPDGNIGINYTFRVAFDASPPGTLYSVNGHLINTFDNLVTQMNTAFGGSGDAFIVGNKVRVESATGPVGSVVIEDGGVPNSTTNLF